MSSIERQFVNAASLEESIQKIVALKTEQFEDVVLGIIGDTGLHSTVMIKGLTKKMIDSGFTDTEQAIFTGALIAASINGEEIKSWFSEQNLEFLTDIDNYSFIVTGEDAVQKNEE
jgi:hypothetical protein